MHKYTCEVCENEFLRDWENKKRPKPKYCSLECYSLAREKKHERFIGKKLGKLTVISVSKIRDKRSQINLICKCDCGNIKNIPSHHFDEGQLVSCGCWKSGRERMLPTFMNHIEKTEKCWKWNAYINKAGYARHNHKYAHRLSYEYFKGKIPEGLMICHKCNNKSCINPDHLYAGTAYDNAQDAVKCGVLLGRNTRKKL